MSAPFVGCRVQVLGTSKAELNGKHGRATGFNSERGRYTVVLDNGETIALKPSNVDRLPGGEDDGGAASGGMPGVDRLFQSMGLGGPQLAQAQAQLAEVQRMLKGFLPPGVDLSHAAAGLAVLSLLTIYFLVSKMKNHIFSTRS